MAAGIAIPALLILTLATIPSAATAQRLPQSETRTLETNAGQPVLAYRFNAFGSDCIGHEPEIHIAKSPAHGKVELKPGSFEVGSILDPSATQVCTGRRVRGCSSTTLQRTAIAAATSLRSRSSCEVGLSIGPIK